MVSRPATSENAPLAAGTRFGTYRVERLIGTGGMGSVYEATHMGLKKRVALKILHQSFVTNDEVKARFLREGEATARINHPNVVQMTDLGVKDGLPYLVMELLVGESLSDKLGREKLFPVDRAVDVLLPIISAVGMAHDEGVVHRDLKPDNIFLAKNRLGLIEAKLLDFGISKMTTRSELTTAASVLGTPHYLSPEQAQASRDIDGRSDQYSLSVILYRLVTGSLPVGGEIVTEILMAVAQGRVRPPRAVRPELADDLERIIMRGLATQPKDRYSHIHLMGLELLPFASPVGYASWRAHFEMRCTELGAEMSADASGMSQTVLRMKAFTSADLAPGPVSSPIAVPPHIRHTPGLGPPGVVVPSAAGPSVGSGPAVPAYAQPPQNAAQLFAAPTPYQTPMGPFVPGLPTPIATPMTRPSGALPPSVRAPIGAGSGPPSSPGLDATIAMGQPAVPAPLRQPIGRGADEDRAFAGESVAGEAIYGPRWPTSVMIMALLAALIVIGGGMWWLSQRDQPLHIAAERPVATYRVLVTVEPSSAEILIDGVVRGHGKLDIELPVDGTEHKLEARAAGYETEVIEFKQGKVPPDVVKLSKR